MEQAWRHAPLATSRIQARYNGDLGRDILKKRGRVRPYQVGKPQHRTPRQSSGEATSTKKRENLSAQIGYGAVEKGQNYKADPTGRRIGNALDATVAAVLTKTLEEAVEAQHSKHAANKTPLTVKALEEAIDKVRGAVMICYPMGLPDWDVVRQCLEGNEELAGTSYANDEFDPESSQLWFAGKMMIPENKLSDHVGRHEKTKVVVKVTKKGSGAPQREQAIDQTTQKEMMAFYHRKQEEMKKLADNQDDDYTASTWANPKSLKGHFAGVSDVRFR